MVEPLLPPPANIIKQSHPTEPQHSEASAMTLAAHLSNMPMSCTDSSTSQARPLDFPVPLPAVLADVVADHMMHLESLLDLILAMIIIIQSVSTTSTFLISSHA